MLRLGHFYTTQYTLEWFRIFFVVLFDFGKLQLKFAGSSLLSKKIDNVTNWLHKIAFLCGQYLYLNNNFILLLPNGRTRKRRKRLTLIEFHKWLTN